MIEEKVFSFGKITFKGNIVTAEMNEGILFDTDEKKEIFDYCETIYKGKPYVYLSYRINSYSINPVVYLQETPAYNNMAIAVVTQKPLSKLNTSFEKHFYNKQFEVFSTLEEAEEWLLSILEEYEA